MAKNLIRILQTFSKEEVRDFRTVLECPYFNKGRDYTVILDGLSEYILEKGKDTESSFENFFMAKEENRSYSKQTLRNRFSELKKLTDEFLVIKNIKNDRVHREKLLLNEYKDRGLHKEFEKRINSLKGCEIQKFNFNTDMKDIHFLHAQWLSMTGKNFHNQYLVFTNYLVSCFFLIVFDLYIEHTQQKLHRVKSENNLVDLIARSINLKRLKAGLRRMNFQFSKEVKLHTCLFSTFSEPDNKRNYLTAKKFFFRNINSFSEEYKNSVLKVMTNHCINRMNIGEEEYVAEVFYLFKKKLELGLFDDLKKFTFPLNNFRDYVFIGIKMKDLKWTENFIRKYSHFLPAEQKENELNLSLAKIDFEKGKFEKSLELVNKVNAENYIYYIDKSRLRMKNFFELGMLDEGYEELSKHAQYLKNRPDIPLSHLNTGKQFMNNYKFILKMSGKAKDQRKEMADLDPHTPKKDWFGEKVREMVREVRAQA